MSIPMSFGVGAVSNATRRFIIVFAVCGFLSPIAYLVWWGFWGGRQWETGRGIEKLISRDPETEAYMAVSNGDYRLYCTGQMLAFRVPGVTVDEDKYHKTHGLRGCATFSGENLSAEQERLNSQAMAHMAAFNRIVYASVKRASVSGKRGGP